MSFKLSKTTISVTTLVASFILLLASPLAAEAWGGPTYFHGTDCSGYSSKTSSSHAGANTVDVIGGGGTIKVSFRYPGHINVAPVSGTGYVISNVTNPSIVALLTGGHHECRGSALNT
ncbi:MAG: hypothetical protein IT191_05115 [Microbacteriaceae bacterium]|nr:hypothetical protein [Microbacteriaceae bacterium]